MPEAPADTAAPSPATNEREPGSRLPRWWRLALLLVVVPLAVALGLVALGALVPELPVAGAIGTGLIGTFPLYAVLIAVLVVLLGTVLWSTGSRYGGGIGMTLGGFGTAAALIVLISQLSFAATQGVSISWWQLLTVPHQPAAQPDRTVRYATVGGVELKLSVWLPGRPATRPRPAVVWVHGGGFVAGHRDELPGVDRWLADRGYPVFDIDYRLAPPPRWRDASQDVACALAWVARHAAEYQVAPGRIALVGGSAGGSLSLNVAYGLADGEITSGCGGSPPTPAVAVGFYPAADIAGIYHDGGPFGYQHRVGNAYLGGSPEQFPGRYRAASATSRIRPGLMPTLLVTGAGDHLIEQGRVTGIADRLTAADVPHRTVVVPYGEHAFDISFGGVGGQISRQVLGQFLDRHLPAGNR
ncbi:alpha/beta hydrolase [Amycolatopsis aidingensis]|uniref:alpha/beta hydrolase n=1 Tax=Amycolatopsis aidingensis TaxID=2842453 RepID=UPI001C0C112C|nr:alpha/beta hydrolase [Amycolatopsis aidingensis]